MSNKSGDSSPTPSESRPAKGDETATDELAPPPEGRTNALVFILVTLLVDILGIGIVIPVLPGLIAQFVGGETNASWYVGLIGTSYAMMQFVFSPLIGALSDRFGRRPVLLMSLFGLGVDYIIQGFAPSIGWLFAGRIIAGIMGASITTAHAYIADVSTPETRARNFGLAGAMFGVGFTFGPALGGILGEYSLRLPFFVSAALALANWLYGYFILPESLPPESRTDFDISRANPFATLGLIGQYPMISGLSRAFICLSLAQRGLENVWVLYTMFMFGWGELKNGLVLGLVGVMAVIVQGGLVRPAIKRFGERKAVLYGLAISTVVFAGYGLATQEWMIMALIVLGSLGGICGPALQSLVAGSVSPSDQGKVQGALTSLISITSIIAPFMFTSGIFRYFTSLKAPIQFAGAPFLVGSMLLFVALLIARSVFRKLPAEEA